ncbi:unnamed protein product [Rotaria magnacalcarata]|uniref:Uncharacterized protein n=1 Tax=Rotaria magnacalcarata TaxID=392030 RepID=A0A816CLX7_9BILA|nr:unnamed protein product [Rotaria magnacalcarata]CAF3871794.1 unnamed protein product [Rotaria magnacalcarata]CAF4010195.1 unnamed protein product [Rotaria magnacalcarata]CAF4087725.1 unnamed protein product [Rotaria magnacalcarata]
MFIFSLQCVRQRSGFYQLFRYSHYLFWPIFILLVIHVSRKIYLLKRHLPKYGRTRLISVRTEDEHVLSLIIERPNNFSFHIGE